LSGSYPDAIVLLSVREDADSWWRSASNTIFDAMARGGPPGSDDRWHAMTSDMLQLRFTEGWRDEATAKAAYERHNQTVRASTPSDRLVEWRPGDGWDPLCAALGLPVPDEPFPHVNTTAEFRAMTGLDAS
jgi:hypothetical protein